MALFRFLMLAASFLASCAPALAEADRYVILTAGGETAGRLEAETDGPRTRLDYVVDSNGRGARNTQTIIVGPDGVPVSWTIEGRSLFGDPVLETMRFDDGVQEWTSRSDEGRVERAEPQLYVAVDDSPWSLGLYARALLRSETRTAEALPGGEIRLEPVRAFELADGEAHIHRLTGLSLQPAYILLETDGRLAASFSAGRVVILEHLREYAPALRELYASLERERMEALQAELAIRFDAPVQIADVHVFDPRTGERGPLSLVTVFEDRIAAIEPMATARRRADSYWIDGAGGTLVPGLHDMHAHIDMQDALNYIAAGVTSVRDMGNTPGELESLVAAIEAGALAGPRVTRSGMIEGRSPFSVHTGIIADTLEEAIEAVRWYAAHGYWQIKIYNSLHPEWLEPVAAEAHRLGLGVTGHVPAFVTPDQAIRAGYDEIAHVNQLMLGWLLEPDEDTRTPIRLTGMQRAAALDLDSAEVRETLALMETHGVALDTTASTLELLMLSRSGQYPETARAYVEHMPIGYRRNRKRAFVTIETEADDAAYRAGFQSLLDTLALLHERGIQLLPGTDAGTGLPLHRELALYVEAGLAPSEALALGTLRAETYLGRDQQLGSIERGKLADFFLIPGDPTADIEEIGRIRFVMAGGVGYLPSDIYTRLGIRPFVEPVHVEPPAAEAAP